MKPEVLAAIDIGSNAVRLLVNTVEVNGPEYSFKKAAYLRVPIRLGEDVFTTRRVGDSKAAHLVEAMQGFTHIMTAFGVLEFRACATSAMRDASNGPELTQAIRERTGIDVQIISGQEEADLVYAAAAQRKLVTDGVTRLHVDVGGGSTELILYTDGQFRLHDSFQLGTVRMLTNAVADSEKERFIRGLHELCSRYAPECVVASGGNINKTHKLLGKKNGEPIRPRELGELLERLSALSIQERMRDFDLNDYRADVIVPALQIFQCICAQCSSIRTLCVPKIGLADGLILDMYKKRSPSGAYNKDQ